MPRPVRALTVPHHLSLSVRIASRARLQELSAAFTAHMDASTRERDLVGETGDGLFAGSRGALRRACALRDPAWAIGRASRQTLKICSFLSNEIAIQSGWVFDHCSWLTSDSCAHARRCERVEGARARDS